MNLLRICPFLFWVCMLPFCTNGFGGTLVGHLRDPNWFGRPSTSVPYGAGQYEYGINANGANISALGGLDDTDVFGFFAMSNLTAGAYTVASWDVWARSAYRFNVSVPASGNSIDVDLRQRATMWGYAAFWSDTGYTEFGQTFVATGPISMIYLRCPPFTGSPTYTLTVHENGPGGAQVGVSRSFGAGDQRPIYGYNQMPTIAGRTYYARIRTSPSTVNGIISQMDPRPDFSDPMPGGWLYLGSPSSVTPHPDRDLGLVIMSDDDGLLTNLYARKSGADFANNTSVGQTFIARGVNVISVALWLADPGAPVYVVRVREEGPLGAQVGTTKRGRPPRLNADPEMIVTWAPGECPLVPDRTYYIEVTRDGGGAFNAVNVHTGNPFAYGEAYRNGTAVPGTDLAGTIMEEQSPGSATQPTIQFTTDPMVSPANRTSNSLTITWSTDVPSDSLIDYAVEYPPYVFRAFDTNLVTSHSLTITGLQAHTMYHYQAVSSADGYRPALSRDFVICTRNSAPNLLRNPSFEDGSGASPRSAFPAWAKSGLDIRTSDGTWLGTLKPTNGNWLLQGSLNGSSSDGYAFQTVSDLQAGSEYTFSAWLMTAPIENDKSKYDVWHQRDRLIYMRLGIDPMGGTNAAAGSVKWTPRMYSHRKYTQMAISAVAQTNRVTAFISMKGDLLYSEPGKNNFHLYAVDDCVLSHEVFQPKFIAYDILTNGYFVTTFQTQANRTNRLEGSTDLRNWQSGGSFLSRNGLVNYTNTSPRSVPQRTFRARLVP